MERRLRGTLPFCVVMVRNEGRAKRKVQMKELKLRGHCRVATLPDLS